MKPLVIFLFFISISYCALVAPKGCTPFGVRLALGRNYYQNTDSQILSVRFNTADKCSNSYVNIVKQSSIKKVYCQNKRISFNNYTSYIQKCSIDFLKRGDSYEYMAFGWTGSNSDPAVPFKDKNLRSKLIKDGPIKMAVLADWSYLEQKANIYDRLDKAFDSILKQTNQPDVVYLGGDFAYDLSTGNGINYESFLIMLSQISSTWPCILITGNHQYYTEYDFMLFNQSFQLYDITKTNATFLDLGAFSFVMADPYGILYENDTTAQLVGIFRELMNKADKTKPIITTTHYPLACSGASTHCKNQRFILKQFFDMMIDFNTVFYIGAHYHTYERIYPYIKGGDFKLLPSPYILTKNTKYLVSVVEGIAGNDKSIVESYGKISNFTAALSYNQTGYGIMNINNKILTYDHYKSTDWIKPIDSLQIQFDQVLRKLSLRQQ